MSRLHDACHAPGCPLPGALSDATNGAGPFACYLHFGKPRDQHDAITGKIRQRDAVWRAMRDAAAMDPWLEWQPVARHALRDHPDLQPGADEGRTAWLMRVRGVMTRQCAVTQADVDAQMRLDDEQVPDL